MGRLSPDPLTDPPTDDRQVPTAQPESPDRCWAEGGGVGSMPHTKVGVGTGDSPQSTRTGRVRLEGVSGVPSQ